MSKRERWYKRGTTTLWKLAEAVNQQENLAYGQRTYICPLCLGEFHEEHLRQRLLTLEHVPPQRIGGREVTLTCKDCNGKHGTRFDSQAIAEHDLRNMMIDGRPRTVRLTRGDLTANVEMRGLPGGILFVGVPQINPLGRLEELSEQLHDPTLSQESVKISRTVLLKRDRAKISWIRTGYLAAFATFGWVYILRANLQSLRDLLEEDDRFNPPTIYHYDPDGDPDQNVILIIREPAELRGLIACKYGEHTVFLPGLDDLRTIEDVAQTLSDHFGPDATPYTLHGRPLSWPTEPHHRADPKADA